MKNLITGFTAIILILGAALTASADSHMGDMMSEKDMQSAQQDMKCPCMMHGRKMMASKEGMQGMMPMGGNRMGRQVIPTEDGGVLLIMGPFLLKYDAELNLVKKTEIDLGPEDMQKMMDHGKAMREMMQGSMMQGSMMKSSKDNSE